MEKRAKALCFTRESPFVKTFNGRLCQSNTGVVNHIFPGLVESDCACDVAAIVRKNSCVHQFLLHIRQFCQ